MKYFMILLYMTLVGCEDLGKTLKHTRSSLIGLHRKVTIYSSNGEPIKSWEGQFKVGEGTALSFITDEGKEVKVTGTVIVEEL